MNGTALPKASSSIDMEPCTKDHFRMISTIEQDFDTMKMSEKVCPPINSSFDISGKFVLQDMHSIQISIRQCDNTTNSSRVCANDAFIDLYVQFAGAVYVNVVYVNPLINPGSTDYLGYYLEDKNFFTFSRTQGSYSIGYL